MSPRVHYLSVCVIQLRFFTSRQWSLFSFYSFSLVRNVFSKPSFKILYTHRELLRLRNMLLEFFILGAVLPRIVIFEVGLGVCAPCKAPALSVSSFQNLPFKMFYTHRKLLRLRRILPEFIKRGLCHQVAVND